MTIALYIEEGLKLQRLFRSLHFENPGDVMKNQKIPDLESSYKEQSLKERLRTRRLPEKTSGSILIYL